MEQTMKCGKVVNSQGKHVHVKFCPICSAEADAQKNVNLDVLKPGLEETKTDNLEAVSDSKTDIEAPKTESLEAVGDSKSEDDGESWGIKVLGTALLGIGLLIGLLYLAYRWATRKAENTEADSEPILHGISGITLPKPQNTVTVTLGK